MHAGDYPYFDTAFTALAHRGGPLLLGSEGKENTVAAFRAATKLGYQWCETDVRVTADNTLIVFHDDRLDRVSDAQGIVAELPWSQVRQARVSGELIPTFDELLETFPDTNFNVDIKTPSAALPLLDAIRRHSAQHRICVASFLPRQIRRFRRVTGTQIPTAASVLGVVWTAKMPLLSRIFPARGVVLQVPRSHRQGAIELSIVTKSFVERAHKCRRKVHVWTINDRQEMIDLIDLGVDGIMTDCPDVLKNVLLERHMWKES
ncbi:MAG: glycerophosphodiester phosphodiesterase [Propionibacteriaceae bacterium]